MIDCLSLAPKKCLCGRKLDKPQYTTTDALPADYAERVWHTWSSPQWNIKCKCWVVWVWRFPNVWKASHLLPLGRAALGDAPCSR